MSKQRRPDVRNVAIIAQVDHGKTTLVDAMVWQAKAAGTEAGLRESKIAVLPRVTSLAFRGVTINLIDSPTHADSGAEVARALALADGLLLVVDACEGPLPHIRYALRKALELGFPTVAVINKIDRPDARPRQVREALQSLYRDLDAGPAQLDFKTIYCDAFSGRCRRDPDGEEESLSPLFESILDQLPGPAREEGHPLQFQVTALDYDDFLGRLAVGRIIEGRLSRGDVVAHLSLDGAAPPVPATVGTLLGHRGFGRVEIEHAEAGDLVAVAGIEALRIGETVAAAADPRPLPPLPTDEPTLSVDVSVNDSPLAGIDGRYVSADKLRERLYRELLSNVAVRVESTEEAHAFRISGRGELQLAIVLEMMRREGFEMSVSRPRVRTREIGGERHEPVELLVVDCPQEFARVVSEKLARRKGRLTKMVDHGSGRVRMDFRVPSRGLIGFRGEFISDTRGAGVMTQIFAEYGPWEGDIPHRHTSALIADRAGRATVHALEHLQPRGAFFVEPGDEVYEGMIVGESAGENDVVVNICKEGRPLPTLSAASGGMVQLIPPRSMSVEQALDFIHDDELVELTPKALRLRKRRLRSGDGR